MINNGDNLRAQSPLAGVVICCTSIAPEQRGELAKIALQMGADHKYDLTSDVTHLIVGNVDTPKYKYVAKERLDVKVVLPQWVEAVRQSWIKGGDTDVAALEEEHRVPTFYGLRVCVTGFEDLTHRQQLSEAIESHGAEYHGDLTKAVTHLIAAHPKGKKYEYARQWGIKVVSLEWLRDSTERRMVLNEASYDPTLEPEERGKGAWNRAVVDAVVLGKRSRLDERAADVGEPNRRKLRRTASTKLSNQSEKIWANITGGSSEVRQEIEWQGVEPKLPQNNKNSPAKPELRLGGFMDRRSDVQQAGTTLATGGINVGRQGVFQGRVICIHAFSSQKAAILHDHLNSNGAKVAASSRDLEQYGPDDLDQGFIILPHDIARDKLPQKPPLASGLTEVTEWWVESCLHRKALLDPWEDILSRPFSNLSIDGFGRVVACPTSFSPIDLLHVSKVIKLMGGTYDEFLKPTTTVLICGSSSPNKNKLKYAMEHGIAAVTAKWLWRSIRTGKMQPLEDFQITPSTKNSLNPLQRPQPNDTSDDARIQMKEAGQSKRPNGENPRQPGHDDLIAIKRESSPGTNSKNQRQNRAQRTGEVHTLDESTNTKHHEDDDRAGVDESEKLASQPLQELHPELNSPRKPSQPAQSPDDLHPAPKNPEEASHKPALAVPIPTLASEPSADLTNTIAQLLAQKQAARPPPAPESSRARRRHARLGRAPSAASNHSLSASYSRASSVDTGAALNSSERVDAASGTSRTDAAEYVPSQALLYEDASVQEERERMIRRMGGRVEAEVLGPVREIGLVKDAVFEEGVGARVRRRGRQVQG